MPYTHHKGDWQQSAAFGKNPRAQYWKITVTNQNMPKFEALLDFAHKCADQSAVEIMRRFRQKVELADKKTDGVFDPVTDFGLLTIY